MTNPQFTICFDTICQGFSPITDGDNNPVIYESLEAAEKEIDSDPEFYQDCFAAPMEEIGHKTIYTGEAAA